MNYDYLARIRGQISLYTKRKTSNVLEGGFHSIHRGRSLDFDDLKEYDYGDNVADIDWKSSSRTGKILIRRYIADKKHNVLFIGDTGAKMLADTSAGEAKSDLAGMCFGTIAYLADRQGADFSLMMNGPKGPQLNAFRSGTDHIEELIHAYEKSMGIDGRNAQEMLLDAVNRLNRKMIIILITDLDGIERLTEKTIRTVTINNDLLVVNLEDAYLSGSGVYDVGEERYEDDFILGSRELHEAEVRERERILGHAGRIFKKYRVAFTTVRAGEEIVDRTMELFRQGLE